MLATSDGNGDGTVKAMVLKAARAAVTRAIAGATEGAAAAAATATTSRRKRARLGASGGGCDALDDTLPGYPPLHSAPLPSQMRRKALECCHQLVELSTCHMQPFALQTTTAADKAEAETHNFTSDRK